MQGNTTYIACTTAKITLQTFCILAVNVCISFVLVSSCQTISKLDLSCLLLSCKRKFISKIVKLIIYGIMAGESLALFKHHEFVSFLSYSVFS